jgi:uncharacterized protein YndB with AHSA1/START domain
VPRYAADRILPASIDRVWAFLAEPRNFADWWPGVSDVEPDRRGLAPGARWQVVGPDAPSYLRRPQGTGALVILDVVAKERIAFQLTGDRIDAELSLRATEEARTTVSLIVDGPWLVGLKRSFPRRALGRLHALLETDPES